MASTSRSHTLQEPAQLASTMRLLAEAPDRRAFFATLHDALPRLMPRTRVDILANEPYNGDYVLMSSGGEANPLLPPNKRTAAGFAEWLGSQGYGVVSTLPLAGAGRHLGWLMLARRSKAFEHDEIALAGQFAAMIAVRLLYDQCRDDLANRDTYSALLEQRLREAETLRQRAMLAAGAAHDIGNLLASVLGYAELLEQHAPATLQSDLQAIGRAASDGQQLIRRLLALKTPRPVASSTPVTLLPTVIRDAIKLTQPFWDAPADITIKTTLAAVPPVRGNAVEL
ncbi:MAG TPA: histidine kinase dimerization/phospho-acceptor domain-containing protein, partial [Roseiflexaceae bacterium]|nr:histidine kinase dimerization/phospho-acceptor domain-containing protein [Roseiflexaceae bacterium]